MRNIYVPLPEEAVEQLRALAARELRHTKDQAAWLILDGLQRARRERDETPLQGERNLVGTDR